MSGPKDAAHSVATGCDWSTGLNSPTSLEQAKLLQDLGRRLQSEYQGLVEAALPEEFRRLLERLDEAISGRADGKSPGTRMLPLA